MIITYQPALVALSICIAILGSLTSLALMSVVRSRHVSAQTAVFSLVSGGIVMGSTIWSMHFIAMLAVDFPFLVNYNVTETIISIGVAMVATGIGLYITGARKLGVLSVPAGGVLMGGGIAGMHYLGMFALRGCGMAFNLSLVLASIGLAIGASMAALWFAFRERNALMTLIGGIVQGLAVVTMHFVGMAGTFFIPLDVQIELAAPAVPQNLLAYIVGFIAVCAGNFGLVMLMFLSRQQQPDYR